MTRVVKVLWAAARNRWRAAARRRGARARSGYSGPVNLPSSGALLDGANPGIAAAMARVHSYEWLHNAVEDADEAGVVGAGTTIPTYQVLLGFCWCHTQQVHSGREGMLTRGHACSRQ
jgi:hypothetical protein